MILKEEFAKNCSLIRIRFFLLLLFLSQGVIAFYSRASITKIQHGEHIKKRESYLKTDSVQTNSLQHEI